MERGISDRWLKRPTEEPRCPKCHSKLYVHGKSTSYGSKTVQEIWACENMECDYVRYKQLPWRE